MSDQFIASSLFFFVPSRFDGFFSAHGFLVGMPSIHGHYCISFRYEGMLL